jgi:Ubiquitin fusion-degradation protein
MKILTSIATALAIVQSVIFGFQTSCCLFFSPIMIQTVTAASTYQFHPSTQKPISLKSGLLKAISTKWQNANSLAVLEQAVEDYNAEEIVASAIDAASAVSYRRLIVLPLDERFDPPAGVFSHGHVQTGDKMSLPREFWTAIQRTKAEVPWLFEVSRVNGVTGPRVVFPTGMEDPGLDRVVGGAIDFRSPSNYVFLPKWMMQALALKPRDVVDVKLIQTVPAGSAVKLRPHSSEFLKIANHQAVLETELKHYSALVRGSTIPFDYIGKRYYFDVVDLRSAPRGEKVPMAKVQDCDIAAEFIRAKDQIPKKKRKEKSQD